MRFLINFVIVISIIFACSPNKPIDTAKLNKYIVETDSLLKEISEIHNKTLENFYFLTDDSLLLDSVNQIMQLQDSFVIYQLIETKTIKVNEMYFQTQTEIILTQDKLESLKDEVKNQKITEANYLLEIENEQEILDFLKERVESNIVLIENQYNDMFLLSNDSLNEKSE